MNTSVKRKSFVILLIVSTLLVQTSCNRRKPVQATVAPEQNPITELQIFTTQAGNGPKAKKGQFVVVNFRGKMEDGRIFIDTQRGGEEALEFELGSKKTIAGFSQGIEGMQKGEIRKIVIPPNLAYGERGLKGIIPPNATLTFDVELVEIK